MQLKINRRFTKVWTKIWLVTASFVFVGIILFLIRAQQAAEFKAPSRVNVITSFQPYTIFTNAMANGKGAVKADYLANKADYKLTEDNIQTLDSSNLIVHIGSLEEKWLSNYLKTTNKKLLELESKPNQSSAVTINSTSQEANTYTVVSAANSEVVTSIYSSDSQGLPWLSPHQMLLNSDLINTWLGFIDNGSRDQYTFNYREIRQKLVAMDDKYYKSLRECQTRSFATLEGYSYYLAKDYNLDERIQNSKTPKDIKQLSPLKYMFDDLKTTDDYFKAAQSNLDLLVSELGCTTTPK